VKEINVQKGEVLMEAGGRPSQAFEVVSGLLRSYFIDELGKEHTFLFAPEGWILADLEAAGYGVSSKLAIEALEDSVVVMRPIFEVEAKMLKGDMQMEWQRMLRRAGVLQRRVLMMMSTSALERYEYFLETYPELSGRITQKLIASYLGITPQALSKLRSDRVKDDRK